MARSPFWTAPRGGHDWRDEDTLRAVEWFEGLVPAPEWRVVASRVRATFEAAKATWSEDQGPLYDPAYGMAWYLLQGRSYAADRGNWVEGEAYRLVPIFQRIGKDLDLLRGVDGAEERGRRLLRGGRSQADSGLYEFLIALAYRRAGWEVRFVPERPGVARTPDLEVAKGRRRWAAECKRIGQAGYAAEEKVRGEALAEPVHHLARTLGRSCVVYVSYKVELAALPDAYLADHAALFFSRERRWAWDDGLSRGMILPIDWTGPKAVLARDYVYFGSSRMIELLSGSYDHRLDYSLRATWRPSPTRAFYADSVSQASLVSWQSGSFEAARQTARHFRQVVARAAMQLPGDRPGVVHVGYEEHGGNSADDLRYLLNGLEISTFNPGPSRLRYVYTNYMAPEHTTAPDEAAAASETMASYWVGRRRTKEPLPDHMLFIDEPGEPGSHWQRRAAG